MSDFHLIPISQPLDVEGSAASSSVGDFSGRVIAIAVRGIDPVATPQPAGDGPSETEGLLGWGTTHMLVADPRRPAPVWISKDEINAHALALDPGATPHPRLPRPCARRRAPRPRRGGPAGPSRLNGPGSLRDQRGEW